MADTLAPSPLLGAWEELDHPLQTRDEIGFVVYHDKLWVIGSSVVPAGASGKEVFSFDGTTWTEYGPGDFEGQRGPSTVVFNDYIYIIGNAFQTDTYRTNDPASGHWEKVASDAPWGIRHGASVVSFNGKLWLMGGMQYSPEGWVEGGKPEYDVRSFNDIWSSDDGVTWQKVVDEAPWGPRAHINGGAVVLNGRMYLFSGGAITLQPFGTVREHVGEPYRDVWSTADGINWRLETDDAPWAGRTFGSVAVYQDQLVLMGGSVGTNHRDMDHDIWTSSDGKTWVQGDFPGLSRHASGMIAFQDDLYIAGGLQADDVWRFNGPHREPDCVIAEDTPFALALPPDATQWGSGPLEASLLDGSPLPAWLHFDAATGSLGGTPGNANVGSMLVRIRATDAPDDAFYFRLSVTNVNDAPTSTVTNVILNPGTSYSFDATAVFQDDDVGDRLGAIIVGDLPAAGQLLLDGIEIGSGQRVEAAELAALRFVPPAHATGAGVASISFFVEDLAGERSAALSHIHFSVEALAPEARDGTLVIQEGAPANLSADRFAFVDGNTADALSGVVVRFVSEGLDLTLGGIAVVSGQRIAVEDLASLAVSAILHADPQQSIVYTPVDSTGIIASTNATLTVLVNSAPTGSDRTIHLAQNRIFMPSVADFAFHDSDIGDVMKGIRIDQLPALGKFVLNNQPILVGDVVPAHKISQLAYIPLGTINHAYDATLRFSVLDDRGGTSTTKTLSFVVDDILYRNVVTGDPGGAMLVGDDGNNVLHGGMGDDVLVAGLGDDVLEGGEGRDTVTFAGMTQDVGVELGPLQGQGTGVGVKWLWNIENLTGGYGNDRLIGDAGSNVLDGGDGDDALYGENGDDILVAGIGDDILHGGSGTDTVSFADATANVGARLGIVAGQGTGVGVKWLWDVENLTGGHGNDRLIGDAGSNVLDGGDGDDALYGEDGDDILVAGIGDDILHGGSGTDTVSFADATVSVGARLGILVGQGTGVGVKWLWDVENLTGGHGNDRLIGDAGSNVLDGGDGDDALYGEDGDDILVAGVGDDIFHGGSGNDTLTFADSRVGVVAMLGMVGLESGVGLKTIRAVENLVGSSFDDDLRGDDKDNVLEGGTGDDALTAGAGQDFLSGGSGADTFHFHAGTTGASVILDFSGRQGDGDTLVFHGFGDMPAITMIAPDHWQIEAGAPNQRTMISFVSSSFSSDDIVLL